MASPKPTSVVSNPVQVPGGKHRECGRIRPIGKLQEIRAQQYQRHARRSDHHRHDLGVDDRQECSGRARSDRVVERASGDPLDCGAKQAAAKLALHWMGPVQRADAQCIERIERAARHESQLGLYRRLTTHGNRRDGILARGRGDQVDPRVAKPRPVARDTNQQEQSAQRVVDERVTTQLSTAVNLGDVVHRLVAVRSGRSSSSASSTFAADERRLRRAPVTRAIPVLTIGSKLAAESSSQGRVSSP